jgi:hypothetical protein
MHRLQMSDAMATAADDARRLIKELRARDYMGGIGFGTIELFDGDMMLKQAIPFTNLITDVGDCYYALKSIVGISPANATAPTAVNGMKLGTTSSTAPAKNGTGAALQAYLSGSNVAFDSTFPAVVFLGAGLGANAQYKTTWGAGVATSATIVEAVIVTDQATNATTAAGTAGSTLTAPYTISRVTFTTVNKGASDTLAITWNHKFLGS